MKRIAFIGSIFMLATISHAQVRWGAEAGADLMQGSGMSGINAGGNIGATLEYGISKYMYIDGALKLNIHRLSDNQPYGFYPNPKRDAEGNYIIDSSQALIHNRASSFNLGYLSLPIRFNGCIKLSDKARIALGVGPTVNLGIFGRGKLRFVKPSENPSAAPTAELIKTGNAFGKGGEATYSDSRLQLGANARLSCELFSHYSIAIEYSSLWNMGKVKETPHINVLSLNVGYKF